MKDLKEIRSDLRKVRESLWASYTDTLRYASSLSKRDRAEDAVRVDLEAAKILATIKSLSAIV